MAWAVAFDDIFNRADSGTVGNGWTASVANVFAISGQKLVATTSDAQGYLHNFLTRPSSEAQQDTRITWRAVYSASSVTTLAAFLRFQGGNNYYLASISQGSAQTNLDVFSVVNGSPSFIAAVNKFNSPPDGQLIQLDFSAVGINPTVLTFSVSNAQTGAVYQSFTVNDSSSALQSAGSDGLTVWTGGGNASSTITEVTTYVQAAVVAANDPSIAYSPGNWVVSSASAKSVFPGAYFRWDFASGSSIALNFDTTNVGSPVSEVAWQVDGQGWNSAPIASSINVAIPSATANWPKHRLDVVFKSISVAYQSLTGSNGKRWLSPQNGAIVFTGITIGNGTSTRPPTFARSALALGDSITEGFHAIVNATPDTPGSDARLCIPFRLREMLGMEVAAVGYCGSAVLSSSNSQPTLQATYNQHWDGQARDISGYDLIWIAYGQNDPNNVGDNAFISAYVNIVKAILAANTKCMIACVVPYSQAKAPDIATVVAQVGSSRVKLITTVGMLDSSLTADGLHPLGVAYAQIAPQLADKLRPLLEGVKRPWSYA